MKHIVIFSLCLSILAAPCLYDVTSREPSPMAAALVTVGVGCLPVFGVPAHGAN
jgi:hypothetical protein